MIANEESFEALLISMGEQSKSSLASENQYKYEKLFRSGDLVNQGLITPSRVECNDSLCALSFELSDEENANKYLMDIANNKVNPIYSFMKSETIDNSVKKKNVVFSVSEKVKGISYRN